MTIKEKLTTINNSLNAIKQAVVAKGQTPSGDITTYATAIGNITTVNGQTKTVTPSTSQQTVQPDNGYNALTSVTVNAVTSSIDNNITAGNIKKDVTILGVTGTYEGSGGGSNDCMLSINIDDFTLRTNNYDTRNYPITNIKFNNVSYFNRIGYFGISTSEPQFKGNILLPKNTSVTCEISLASEVIMSTIELNNTTIYSGSNTVTFTLTGDSTLYISVMADGGAL